MPDINDLYNLWGQMKQQAAGQPEQPDLSKIQDVTNAGINVRNGDPRLQSGFTLDKLNPQEQQLWAAYLNKMKGTQ